MQAETDFNAWLEKYGRSTCDAIMRKHLRKRLQVDGEKRPEREKLSDTQREKMYLRQHGRCGICRRPMDFADLNTRDNTKRLEVDHINVNLEGEAYTHRRNLQIAHKKCNAEKNAMSVPEQAKRYGRTMTDILGGADAENDI